MHPFHAPVVLSFIAPYWDSLATDILTNRGDLGRTGLNATETILHPENVKSQGLVSNTHPDGSPASSLLPDGPGASIWQFRQRSGGECLRKHLHDDRQGSAFIHFRSIRSRRSVGPDGPYELRQLMYSIGLANFAQPLFDSGQVG
jgi:hypothetical protein